MVWTNSDGLKVKFATEEANYNDDLGQVHEQFDGSGYFNFKPSNLVKWRIALGNVQRGTADAKIALVGDSTTRGQGSGTTTAQGVNGYSYRMADYLTGQGISATAESLFGTGNYTVTSFDSRVAQTGTFTTASVSVGANAYRMAASATLTFTPTTQCDSFDIYTINNGTGQFTVNVNGGSTLATINTTTAGTITKTSVTNALGNNDLRCVWVSGAAYILGIDAWNSATKKVKVWNWGWASSTTSNWSDTSTGFAPTITLGSGTTIPADLYIMNLGINDWEARRDVDTFSSQYQTMITAAKNNGSVILMTPLRSGANASERDQFPYIRALYRLAVYNDIPLFDVWNRNGSYTTANTNGFMTDTKHPTAAFYSDTSRYFINKLISV